MKNFRKLQYGMIALGFVSTLMYVVVELLQGKSSMLAITCIAWIVYVFFLERQADHTEKRIKELNQEIQDIISNIGKTVNKA